MSFLLDNVGYHYRSSDRLVISGLGLEVPGGATTAILGRSGVGKSTLLYLLGLLWEGQLASGRIVYRDGSEEHVYDRLGPSSQAKLRRERFGFVLQSSYLLPHLTCAENLAMPLALSGAGPGSWDALVTALARRADADAELHGRASTERNGDTAPNDDLGLSRILHATPERISGGQRQRIGLLRALIHDPSVVFADEPFSSLDTANTELVLGLLRDWRTGALGARLQDEHGEPVRYARDRPGPRTLLLVCHDLDIAWAHADYFVVLNHQGRAEGGRALSRADFPNGPDDLGALIASNRAGARA